MNFTKKAICQIFVFYWAITPVLLAAQQEDSGGTVSKSSGESPQESGQAGIGENPLPVNQPIPSFRPSRQSGDQIGITDATGESLLPSQKSDRIPLVRIEYQKHDFWGRPLAWDGKQLALLGLDGQLNILPVASKSQVEVTPAEFQPFSTAVMRKRLEREFGKRHQITPTANFVVVHPYGDREIWAPPFEALYKRFREYFESHGFELREPEFPLVAVVLRSRSEFDRHLDRKAKYNRNIMGIYMIKSNRMVTYDPKAKLRTAARDKQWLFEYKTVIHELAHQAAFNTGVHNRFSPPSTWVGEGLAMMFETRGVNNCLVYTQPGDRVNRTRLKELKQHYANGKIDGKLEQLITHDRMFETDPFVANSMAWGLTFYLSEKFPEQYFEFLKNDGSRKSFQPQTPPQRLGDFAKSFGPDLQKIETDMKAFINGF